jgi:hypothetical protein
VHLVTSFDGWVPERMLLHEPKEKEVVDPSLHCTLKVRI